MSSDRKKLAALTEKNATDRASDAYRMMISSKSAAAGMNVISQSLTRMSYFSPISSERRLSMNATAPHCMATVTVSSRMSPQVGPSTGNTSQTLNRNRTKQAASTKIIDLTPF